MFSTSRAIRSVLVVALAATALALPATPANAGQSGFYDCSVTVLLWPGTSGSGNIKCSHRHATTTMTLRLKFNGHVVDSATRTVTFTNSYGMGNHTLYTPAVRGCGYWQTVASFYVSGNGSDYRSSGAPVFYCT